MSLPDFSSQSALFASAALGHDFFAANDRYRLFAQKIYPLLVQTRSVVERAYCASNGRAATEPVLLLGLTLLQFLEGAPDRQAVDLLRYHVGWNFALNRCVGDAVFHPTTLVYFRSRLLDNKLDHVVFAKILEALIEAGLVERRGKQRLDSTQILGLVSRMSRLECVRETFRLALQELAGRAALFAKPSWWEQLWERYVGSKLDYRTETSVLKDKMNQAGVDGVTVLAWVGKLSDATVAEGAQIKLLQRVLEENYTWTEGQPPVQKEAQPTGALHNPHEPEAQWAAKGCGKRRKEHVGYKVQVAESVHTDPLDKAEPTRSFLTGISTQPASASDEAGAEQVQQEQAVMGVEKPSELYVDAAYISAAKLAEAAAQGRQLIGPAQPAPEKEGRFSSEDFQIQVEDRKAICPAAKESSHCSRLEEKETGKVTYRFEWTTHCRECPLRQKCCGQSQKHRTLVVGQHHAYLQTRRQEQKTEQFQKKNRHRNAIEGTQSELVRAHGLRQARYRGLSKVRLQNYFIGAACNAKRWIKRMAWEFSARRATMEPALHSG